MKTEEVKVDDIRLRPVFTVDVMQEDDDPQDQMQRYNLALSATGSARVLPGLRVAYSRAIVSGMVSAEDCVGGYLIHPETIKYPSGLTRKQATTILRKIFEDAGRGSAADEGWAWKPVQVLNFLLTIFDFDSSHDIAAILRKEVENRNSLEKSKNNKG